MFPQYILLFFVFVFVFLFMYLIANDDRFAEICSGWPMEGGPFPFTQRQSHVNLHARAIIINSFISFLCFFSTFYSFQKLSHDLHVLSLKYSTCRPLYLGEWIIDVHCKKLLSRFPWRPGVAGGIASSVVINDVNKHELCCLSPSSLRRFLFSSENIRGPSLTVQISCIIAANKVIMKS